MALTPSEFEDTAVFHALDTTGITQTNYQISNAYYTLKNGTLIINAVVKTITPQSQSYIPIANLPTGTWNQALVYVPDNGGGYLEVGIIQNKLAAIGGVANKSARFQVVTA